MRALNRPKVAPNSQLPSMLKVGQPEVVSSELKCLILSPNVWLCLLNLYNGVYCTVQMYDISRSHA